MRNRKSESVYSAFYASHYDFLYARHENDKDILKIQAYLDRIDTDGRILDIGCGTGSHCAIVRETHANVEGLDISQGMLEVARRKNPGLTFTAGNLLDKGLYAPNSFSMIYSIWCVLNYLESVEEFQTAFHNMHDWVCPGGWICFEILLEHEYPPGSSTEPSSSGVTNTADFRIDAFYEHLEPSRKIYQEKIWTPEMEVSNSHDLLLPSFDMVCEMIENAGFEYVENVSDEDTPLRMPFFCCRARHTKESEPAAKPHQAGPVGV